MTTKTIIYTRISRDEEDAEKRKETSPAIQEKDCREYAKLKKTPRADGSHRPRDLWVQPKGCPTRYDVLLADIRAGEVEAVVVYKIDRLTRQMRQLVDFIDLITEHSVR